MSKKERKKERKKESQTNQGYRTGVGKIKRVRENIKR